MQVRTGREKIQSFDRGAVIEIASSSGRTETISFPRAACMVGRRRNALITYVTARGRFDHNILNANRQYPDTFSSRRKKMR